MKSGPYWDRIRFLKTRNTNNLKRRVKAAIARGNRKPPSEDKVFRQYRYLVRQRRLGVLRSLHSSFNYVSGKRVVTVNGGWGIEDPAGIEAFLDVAEQIIDFDERELIIELHSCTRVWPSAVTLLCSLKEWVEFGAKNNGVEHPHIRSTNSQLTEVNSYLTHCGFHEYVKRRERPLTESFSSSDTVRIVRELSRANRVAEEREDQLLELIVLKSHFSPLEAKSFISSAILETLSNVQEHGMECNDKGFWVLAQHHAQHGFISINIADNGVGIRHSLLTGPQRDQIRTEYPGLVDDDGAMIHLAFRESVSGALDASVSEEFSTDRGYRRGSGRGNGLDRIRAECSSRGIPFTVLSHYGYLSFRANGSILAQGTRSNRVFAGTLYQFIVPTGVRN